MSHPQQCPECGARDSLTTRYATGGGWRSVGYRCGACGAHIDKQS